jgi:hypothetical protein
MINNLRLFINAHGKEFSACFESGGVFEGAFSCSIDTNPISYRIFYLKGELAKRTLRFSSTRFNNL